MADHDAPEAGGDRVEGVDPDDILPVAVLAGRSGPTGPDGPRFDEETRAQLDSMMFDDDRYVRVYVALVPEAVDAPRVEPGDVVHLSEASARDAARAGSGVMTFADVHASTVILDRASGEFGYQGGRLASRPVIGEGQEFPPRPVWTVGSQDERWDSYLRSDSPWVPENFFGESTPDGLRFAEDRAVEARATQLGQLGIPHSFDLAGLQEIHRHLFQDVYPWAGELRTVNMSKGDAGFAPSESLAESFEPLSDLLRDSDGLRTARPDLYTDTLAAVYHSVNLVHPFREGNGRTNRVFMNALAAHAGYELDWTQVRGRVNDFVSQVARATQNMEPMQRMFREITRPIGADPEALEARRSSSAGRPASMSERLTKSTSTSLTGDATAGGVQRDATASKETYVTVPRPVGERSVEERSATRYRR